MLRLSAFHFSHYEALGLRRTATHEEIRRAYLRLAKQYHPDANPHASQVQLSVSVEKFRRTRSAWEALGTPERRSAYDRAHSHEDPSADVGSHKRARPGRTPRNDGTDWQRRSGEPGNRHWYEAFKAKQAEQAGREQAKRRMREEMRNADVSPEELLREATSCPEFRDTVRTAVVVITVAHVTAFLVLSSGLGELLYSLV
mmetsp:Transcript_84209/g.234892  ORF Transcript_84209/g.234892 Transcript_84209/m.234892 type:complete len:200 (+) Transcript_84209:86-685(+)